ncbi:MAG: hypothetical protein DWQ19_09025 [Crenarchaeota archaeon]|nr:MAG: hypothetical protein DWQ19_09025 [Thermoproteota archaeon]
MHVVLLLAAIAILWFGLYSINAYFNCRDAANKNPYKWEDLPEVPALKMLFNILSLPFYGFILLEKALGWIMERQWDKLDENAREYSRKQEYFRHKNNVKTIKPWKK